MSENNERGEREILIEMHSDLYKELYGYRPRIDWSRYTTEDIRPYFQDLIKISDSEIQHNDATYLSNARLFTRLAAMDDEWHTAMFFMDAEDWSRFVFERSAAQEELAVRQEREQWFTQTTSSRGEE